MLSKYKRFRNNTAQSDSEEAMARWSRYAGGSALTVTATDYILSDILVWKSIRNTNLFFHRSCPVCPPLKLRCTMRPESHLTHGTGTDWRST